MFKKNGFTLTELMIVFAIIAAMGTAMVAILNPGALSNRGYDARRKKDIRSIKIAFEEYFNDRECYPTQAEVDALTCRQKWYSLNNFPCDPSGAKYKIQTDGNNCPKWFRVMTNLLNRQDKDIPTWWYAQPESKFYGNTAWNKNALNFGVSSTNINWYDELVPAWCYSAASLGCHYDAHPGCGSIGNGTGKHYNVPGNEIYLDNDCLPACQVSCCEDGAICK